MSTATASTTAVPAADDDREFVISRVFDAPRPLVFAAWTDPRHLSRWWGPHTFTVPVCEMDVRPGGAYRIVMRGPDGVDYPVTGVFREVTAPERLVFTDAWDEHPAEWQAQLAERHEGEDPPAQEAVNTVTFAEEGGKTRVTIRTRFASAALRDAMVKMGMEEGWAGSLERLDLVLAEESPAPTRVVEATRTFAAPRELVFAAITRPEHVRHWYGPRRYAMASCEIDLRPEGSFRYVLRGPDGAEHAFSGTYREVEPPVRLLNTWAWEAMPDHVSLESATLHEHEGSTTVRLRSVFPSGEDYAGWVGSGGPGGMEETLDRLTGVVAQLSLATGGSDREMVLSRLIDAPRELVFRAFTDPEHLPHWHGPRGFTLTMQEIDVRPGGVWRYVMHGPDGTDYVNWIRYDEIVAPERLEYAHGGEGDEPHFHVVVTFAEEGGKTRLTMRSIFPTAEARAFVMGFGAVELGYQTLDRLVEHLARM